MRIWSLSYDNWDILIARMMCHVLDLDISKEHVESQCEASIISGMKNLLLE